MASGWRGSQAALRRPTGGMLVAGLVIAVVSLVARCGCRG